MLTWDSRGFGESGGTVKVDSKDFEGRDVQALLDWLAEQPEATARRARRPARGHARRLLRGRDRARRGGDRRADRRDRAEIAWHSLLTSLYKEETVKGGWSSLLYAAGQTSGRLDPHIGSAFASGATTGKLSAEDRAWFESRGPGDALVKRIRVPTLLLQGTADTLFTTTEAIRNYEILRRNRVPVKMMWFCGGHGTCLTGTGPAGHFEAPRDRVAAQVRRHATVDAHRPRLRVAGRRRRLAQQPGWPPPRGAPLVAAGSGTLALTPLDTVSGTPIAAGPAANAVNVPIPAATAQVVGEPRLRLTYSGTGTATHVFAQIVDEKRNVVLGNLVTPLPVTLDGATHTVTRPLEGVAASMTPAARYHLQVIGGSQVYGPVRGAAAITLSNARLELPTVGAPKGCQSAGASRLLLPRRGKLRSAKVWVAGKRTTVRRRGGRLRAVIDLRQLTGRRVTVRIVGRTKHGSVRAKRAFTVCQCTRASRGSAGARGRSTRAPPRAGTSRRP